MGAFTPPTSPLDGLGWTIVHSLWQGLAVALVYAVGLYFIKDASRRYRLGLACLVALPLMQIATLVCCYTWSASDGLSLPFTLTTDATAPIQATAAFGPLGQRTLVPLPEESWLLRAARDGKPALFWVSGIWVVGVALYLLRYGVASYLLRAELRRCVAIESDSTPPLAPLAKRLDLRTPVQFLRTSETSVPATCGWLHPVVLLPSHDRLQLSPNSVEALVLHELAHIVRRDFLTHQIRRLISFLFFHHPLILWLDRQMTDESERAADDIAAKAMGDRKAYATALLTLEESRLNQLKLGASGGSLKSRLIRIVTGPKSKTTPPSRLSFIAVALFALLILMTCGEIIVRAATPDQKLLESVRRTSMTEAVLFSIGIDGSHDHASPMIAKAVAEQEAGAVSDETLIALSQAIVAGVDAECVVRAWAGLPLSDSALCLRNLPGLGSGSTRVQICDAMTRLASRQTDEQMRAQLSRAACALLALDPICFMHSRTVHWLSVPENVDMMSLTPRAQRSIDFAVAVHDVRSRESAALHSQFPKLNDLEASKALMAAAYEPGCQYAFASSATQQDWDRLRSLLAKADTEVRTYWLRALPKYLDY